MKNNLFALIKFVSILIVNISKANERQQPEQQKRTQQCNASEDAGCGDGLQLHFSHEETCEKL
jgi:hypothetical protein